MSYTSLEAFKVESQVTGDRDKEGHDNFMFHRMIVSKRYIATEISDELYSKGVSYVRRIGSTLQDMCIKMFSKVLLNNCIQV
jgi:hypothetical protein